MNPPKREDNNTEITSINPDLPQAPDRINSFLEQKGLNTGWKHDVVVPDHTDVNPRVEGDLILGHLVNESNNGDEAKVGVYSLDMTEEDIEGVEVTDYYFTEKEREEILHEAYRDVINFVRKYLDISDLEKSFPHAANITYNPSLQDLNLKISILPSDVYKALVMGFSGQNADGEQGITLQEYYDNQRGTRVVDLSQKRHIFVSEVQHGSTGGYRNLIPGMKDYLKQQLSDVIRHELFHKFVYFDYGPSEVEEGVVELFAQLSHSKPTRPVSRFGLNRPSYAPAYNEQTANMAGLFIALIESGKFKPHEIFSYMYKKDSPRSPDIAKFIWEGISEDKRELIDHSSPSHQYNNPSILDYITIWKLVYNAARAKNDIELFHIFHQQLKQELIKYIKSNYNI